MAVSLYTSRVILGVLGVKDFGIYNAVGGAIAMFGVISGALSTAISRYITFELGKKDKEKLKRIFSTSINIQLCLAIFVFIIGESLGLWFLRNHLNIPLGRDCAAFWVLQCSLLSFSINLISIPYNACIVAHEHMKTFAYVSIIEALGKLAICFLIQKSPYDKLISYSVMLVCVAVTVRIIYGIYCKKQFSECTYHLSFDKALIKEMGAFAGWNFFTNGAYIFNTQGVNLLINIFFGVTFNAARGIALQVENAIMQFVNNFGMAINPQITKNYAMGNMPEMYRLICRGSRFSYLLLLIFSLPFFFETDFVLKLWLKVVPDSSALFFRLGLIGTMLTMIGNTGYTACMATGKIKRYVLWITLVGCLVFPSTYVAYKLGAPVYASYLAYIVVYIAVDCVRLKIMQGLIGFPIMMFVKDVMCRILLVTFFATILPFIMVRNMDSSFTRFLLVSIVCVSSSIVFSILFGISSSERRTCFEMIKKKMKRA